MAARIKQRRDNLDLQIRRKRLGVKQRELAERLGLKRVADLSEFETGSGSRHGELPKPHTRADVERALDAMEAERRGAA